MANNGIITLGNSQIINVDFEEVTDKKRNITLVDVPALIEIKPYIPDAPTYCDGKRIPLTNYSTPVTKNNFGVTDFKNFTGTNEEIIDALGARFTVNPHKLRYENPKTGVLEETNNLFLFNEQTGEMLNDTPVSDRYEVLNFEDCIRYFFALVEEIKSHGYDVRPDVGKVYKDGNRMFLQYIIEGKEILGENFSNRLTLMTSHDKKLAWCICLTSVRMFCQNCVTRALKGAEQMIKIRHTKASKEAIEAKAKAVIDANANNHKLLSNYLTSLSTIKVTDENIYDAWLLNAGINKSEQIPLTTATRLTNRLGEYFACLNSPDLNDWRGTALGAYYAFSDFNDHVVAARQTLTERDNRIENALYNGNPDLGAFIDTLVKVAV